MTGVIVRDMRFFCWDCWLNYFHLIVWYFVKLVCTVSSYQYSALIFDSKRNLSTAHVSADTCYLLVDEAFRFIPRPKYNFNIRFSSECDKKSLFSGWCKVHWNKLFRIIISRCKNFSSFQSWYVINTANSSFSFLSDGKKLLWITQCNCRNSFRAFNSLNVFLALIIYIINDNIMTTRVKHRLLFFKVIHVLPHISFKSAEELRLQRNVLGSFRLFQKQWLSILFLLIGSCILMIHSLN